MYPEFARIAEEEGFKEVSDVLKAIARAEERHERRFRVLLVGDREGFATVFDSRSIK